MRAVTVRVFGSTGPLQDVSPTMSMSPETDTVDFAGSGSELETTDNIAVRGMDTLPAMSVAVTKISPGWAKSGVGTSHAPSPSAVTSPRGWPLASTTWIQARASDVPEISESLATATTGAPGGVTSRWASTDDDRRPRLSRAWTTSDPSVASLGVGRVHVPADVTSASAVFVPPLVG